MMMQFTPPLRGRGQGEGSVGRHDPGYHGIIFIGQYSAMPQSAFCATHMQIGLGRAIREGYTPGVRGGAIRNPKIAKTYAVQHTLLILRLNHRNRLSSQRNKK